MTTTALPTFRGWTVDHRLREFRRVRRERNVIFDLAGKPHYGTNLILDFRPFNSPAGAVMLRLYLKQRN